MIGRGVCFVAYGEAARAECHAAVGSLRATNPDLPVVVIGELVKAARTITFPQRDMGGRWAKLNLDSLSPFEHTCYLDADTRARGDLGPGFQMLEDGWDLAIAFSSRQGGDVLGNCPVGDRQAAFEALGTREVLGLQAGVFFVAWNERTRALWTAWREEWERWQVDGNLVMDQAALLRALARVPVGVWVLGGPWNVAGQDWDGRLPMAVEHRFGKARAA